MEALNKNGQILLDYRKEFKRHYADSVDEALKNAIYLLYKDNRINERLFRMILNEELDDLEVFTYLLSQKDFTKSPEELTYEYDIVRQKVNDYLIKIGMIDNISTKNSLSIKKIVIIRQFDVPKDVLLQFFGLSPTEIIPLMKRRGFMDKFCVLRLNQVFKEIYSEIKPPEHIDHGYSLVYYNKDIQGFSIDYKYSVNVNYLNDEVKMRDCLNKIKDLDKICEKKFQNKINFVYFSDNSSEKKSIDPPKEFIKTPTKPIEPILPAVPKTQTQPNKVIVPPTDIIKEPKNNFQNKNTQPQPQPPRQNPPQRPQANGNNQNNRIPPKPPRPPEAIKPGNKPTNNNQVPQQQKQQPQMANKPVEQAVPKAPPTENKPPVIEPPVDKKQAFLVDIPNIEVDEEDKDLL